MRSKYFIILPSLFFLVTFVSLLFQNCTGAFQSIPSSTPAILNGTVDTSLEIEKSCSLNAETLSNGSTTLKYRQAVVSYGSSCQSEVRTCQNGILSGSFREDTCEVAPLQSCVVAGRTLNSGESLKVYSNSKPPTGKTCEAISHIVHCQDGVLDGSGSVFDQCDENVAYADCQFSGVKILHGDSIDAYLSASVPAGEVCISSKRTCQNGVLAGDTNYSFPKCTPNAPASCMFGSLTVDDGDQVVGFSVSTVGSDKNCKDYSSFRTCNNGILDQSNYQYTSCTKEAPASCLFHGLQIPSGDSVEGFKAAEVTSPATCESSLMVCTDGTLVGENQYPAKTCSVVDAGSPFQDLEKLDFKKTIVGDHNQFNLTMTIPDNASIGEQFAIRMEIDGPNSAEFKVFPRQVSVTKRYESSDAKSAIPPFRVRALPVSTGSKYARLSVYVNEILQGAYQLKVDGIIGELPVGYCSVDGILLTTGSSIQLFGSREVSIDNPCEVETVKCTDGQLSGSFRYAECSTSFTVASKTPIYATVFYDKTNNYSAKLIEFLLSYNMPLGTSFTVLKQKK